MKICMIGAFPLPNESPKLGPDNVLYNLVKGIIKQNSDISIDIVTILNDIKEAFVDERFPSVYYLPHLKYLPRSFGEII